MDSFLRHGDFFVDSGEKRIPSFLLPRRYYSFINMLFWAVVVLIPMVYFLIHLFLSGSTVSLSIAIAIILICKYISMILKYTNWKGKKNASKLFFKQFTAYSHIFVNKWKVYWSKQIYFDFVVAEI